MIRIIENLNESKKDKTESSFDNFFKKHNIKPNSKSIGFSEKERK